ncbi:NUDIX hydrolase [Microbacterium sp. zg.Y1090]|uniref:NUDIX domain-containing protein n=1 Tax=Microbacterium TaxID=33882 RepID=UPI00214BF097|nr:MULTISPECIES: NUDIX hydrolase [unclassified Microbacterium]MCR2813391.1 NUDIX hydrolase [Microbacterium sp. zg.Y1084]MCR2818273.1 NUDIX hydrolase [Microbacterium sp. zg.Y1090]MDL5486794.1 NUDIX hydrolase [Microbacterium sp. zg-Y1211]WIM27582.1 NUDIX hydrolase [Microbacterium sp. zg-Y1090]
MTWQMRATREVYANRWIRVREDAVTGPGGDGVYGVVEMRHPAVFVVALDEIDRVCLVEVDRYTVGTSLEVPAGGSDGEDPLLAARRELAEEAGIEASEWRSLGVMNALNGIAVAAEHVYLARGIRALTDAAGTQAEEGITAVHWVGFGEAIDMIADGRITDGETIAALAYAGIRLGRFA